MEEKKLSGNAFLGIAAALISQQEPWGTRQTRGKRKPTKKEMAMKKQRKKKNKMAKTYRHMRKRMK